MDHPADSIRLEVFKHLFASIPEEIGVVLRRSSYSPNIKERRDFSCALFNSEGEIISQAAHIPVHLGAMPLSVKAAIEAFYPARILLQNNHPEEASAGSLMPGDVIILNDPYHGGTHLPDITMVTPVFIHEERKVQRHLGTSKATKLKRPTKLLGFVASRAHHSDVGGITPGSMPIAREIYQEGLIIPPVKLVSQGKMNQDVLSLILANVRTPQERSGDIWAQIAANERGVTRLIQLAGKYGQDELFYFMNALLDYTERITRHMLTNLPDGAYRFTDYMDDDGIENQPIPITACISIDGDHATVDFTGSAPQQKGSINAVYAITLSAVFYVIRCLIGQDIPNNSGCLRPIRVIAPEGSIVNASRPAPVAGGNVETSQRIVDVLLGALAQASPSRIPAASQGTMNNLTIGGWDPGKSSPFAYYETIGGGMGALPTRDGSSAVHSHMTNTLNTPVEA
ncbi:MAG: hydantoinase B/oxoprolinase family protein, partial [Omnitrophica WOR_2 bacterium]